MSYANEPDYEQREERREAKIEASIERTEMKRENPFYCKGEGLGAVKCSLQCGDCESISEKLLK